MAMDPPPTGEQAAAAGLFFRSLRKDYRDGQRLLTDLAEDGNATQAAPALQPLHPTATAPSRCLLVNIKAVRSPRSTRLISSGSWTTSRPWIAHSGERSSGT
jgi:hypothetical protein